MGHQVVYDETFHANRGAFREPAERCLLATFAHFGVPASFLDLGCGTGNLVRLAQKLDAHAIGVDLTGWQEPMLGYYRHDLREPLHLDAEPDRFELVWCTEVAEHLDDPRELLSSVVRYAGNRVIWTAAQPGQGGVGHVFEKSRGYWSHEFALRGLRYEADETEVLRSTWAKVAGRCKWYTANLSIFRRSAG